MFNVFHNHDKIERLTTIMNRIASTGMINMESADALEREIPGMIQSIDPDIMFDIEESEEGVGVAMEASMGGLSRMKIAFIIAVIAFIAKYIMSLSGNTSYAASGGGSGGWGGAAAPTFSTNASPSTPQHHQQIDDYDKSVCADIEKLHDEFAKTLSQFQSSVLDNSTITGMTKNGELKKLCNSILPRIIKENQVEGEGVDKKGFTLFTHGSHGSSILVGLKPFTNITDTKAEVTSGQIRSLKGFLNIIKDNYTVKKVFTDGYVENIKDAINKKITPSVGFGIPFFILSKDLQAETLAFIKLLTSLVENISQTNAELDTFRSVIKPAEQSKPDMLVGGQESKNLWQWLAKNLGKDGAANATVIRSFLDGCIKLLELENQQGEYINTPHINIEIKKFVRASIDGGGITEEDGVDKIFANMPMGDITRTIELITGDNPNIVEVLSPILPAFTDVSDALKQHETDFNKLKDVASDLEEIMRNIIEWINHSNKHDDSYLRSGTSLNRDGSDRLENYDENASEETRLKNLVPMFALVSGLIQVILLSVASAAKYNVELSRFSKARLDLIISKKQAMAKDLYDLDKVMKNIIKESL